MVFSVDEHLADILGRVEPLPLRRAPLLDAFGLPCGEEVDSPIALPVFDNSSMDGYAVLHRDVADATEERPVHLPVVGEIHAGPTDIRSLMPGTAVRIMTGAALPEGADCVVPFEWTDAGETQVQVRQAPEAGQHVRRAGDDIRAGDHLVSRGELLGPRQIGLLASVGHAHVAVPPRPRVIVMSTGAELVEPGRPLPPDSIYDSNSYVLTAAARALGATVRRVNATSDDPEAFAEALEDQLGLADAVVTSGGVSKGTRDVVKAVLQDGGDVEFREVAMQPGKPQGFGLVGPDKTPIFTLPGNPVSSYVSFCVFVVPALRKMLGHPEPTLPTVTAELVGDVRSIPARRQFLRGRLEGGQVRTVGGPGSHLVGGLAAANCLIVLGEDVTRASAGETVTVMPLDGGL